MKLIVTIALGVISVVAVGCQTLPTSFDQGLQLIEKAAKIAEDHGTAYSATISWNGKIRGAWGPQAEIDTGVRMEINMHGNAAAERPTVVKPDPPAVQPDS